jgi:hypothetical protein
MKLQYLAFILSAFLPLFASAYLSVQESNEITPPGKFKLGFEPQMKLSRGSGANFSAFFDAPINDEMSARTLIGAGDLDLFAGASFKWVPIPDYENQPAVGGKVTAVFSKEDSDNFISLGFAPIVSKRFDSEVGLFIPYASLPVNFVNGKSTTTTHINVALGTEFISPKADNMTFGGELGVDLHDSFSYLSAYLTIYLDDKR